MQNPYAPRRKEEWNGEPICRAVWLCIQELTRFYNTTRPADRECINGCSGPALYLPNRKEISDAVRNHPEYEEIKVSACLQLMIGEGNVDKHWSGGYLALVSPGP
jgi:hypothetical protein